MSTALQPDGSVRVYGGKVIPAAQLSEMIARAEAGELPGRPGATFDGALPVFDERLAWLDEARQNKIAAAAQQRHTTPAGIVRDLVDAL